MKTYLYQLRFKGPVHFGTVGIGLENTLEHLSSDSVTSALINAFSVLGGAEEAISALAGENPSFVLSSLFPFGPSEDGSGTAYALPRPLNKPPVENQEILRVLGKDLKRIKYLAPRDFAAWTGESPLSLDEAIAIVNRSQKLAKPWNSQTDTGWWAIELRPRVALDRISNNSSIWHCGALHFQSDAGLFGLVRVIDDSWKSGLSSAFKLLGDLGLGGERTYGMGSFDFSGFEPLDDAWAPLSRSDGKQFVLLSNFFPADDERPLLKDSLVAWDFLETRGYVVSGRMATTLKRKRVRMIAEGSVLKRPLRGKIVDVTPDHSEAFGLTHPVYRSGLAFVLQEGGTP
jgi:CRISPR-associated protein Csm4